VFLSVPGDDPKQDLRAMPPESDDTTRRVIPIAYTPEKAAIVTGRSRTRIFKAIRDQELCARKDGRATLIETSELARWIQSFPVIGRQPARNFLADSHQVTA
jgi:hypothetical protein